MMKYQQSLVFSAISSLFLFSGCDADGRERDSIPDWLAMKKVEFVAAMEQRLDELDQKMETVGDDAKEELRIKRREVSQQFERLREASADAWDTTRQKLLDAVRYIESKLES